MAKYDKPSDEWEWMALNIRIKYKQHYTVDRLCTWFIEIEAFVQRCVDFLVVLKQEHPSSGRHAFPRVGEPLEDMHSGNSVGEIATSVTKQLQGCLFCAIHSWLHLHLSWEFMGKVEIIGLGDARNFLEPCWKKCIFSPTFSLALHSTTEFFVFQQSFYWTIKTIAGRTKNSVVEEMYPSLSIPSWTNQLRWSQQMRSPLVQAQRVFHSQMNESFA